MAKKNSKKPAKKSQEVLRLEAELEALKKKNLRRDRTVLVISIIILILLLLIFWRVSKTFSQIEGADYSVDRIRGNILYLIGTGGQGGSDEPGGSGHGGSGESGGQGQGAGGGHGGSGEPGGSGSGAGGSDEPGSGGSGGSDSGDEDEEHEEPVLEYSIELSDERSGEGVNVPFQLGPEEGFFLPGASQSRVYYVKVTHNLPANVRLGIADYIGNDNILDAVRIKIFVNDSASPLYDGSLRTLRSGYCEYMLNTAGVDEVKYAVTVYLPEDVSDNYAIMYDGNYQGEAFSFSFKWWM